MSNPNDVFDSIDVDRNGVIDRQEFAEYMNPPAQHDTGLMQVIAQRLGTLEASMVRFIEENERENTELKGMLAGERQSRQASEAKMWAQIEAMQAERPTKEAPPSSKALRECVQDNMRLKDQVEHLSKQVATVTRAHRQGKSNNDNSLHQFESRVEERFEEEGAKVAELETKLQCTVEALQLLNSQSQQATAQPDENTSSELVRLEAWIAEEAMQRRRLQERLSGMGVMDSPVAARSMSSPYNNAGRSSPAMSEASDDTWAGLECTLKSIEGGALKNVPPPPNARPQRGAGEARVCLVETAVRELTDQVGDLMQQQRPAESRADAGPVVSSELVKRLERLERKLTNQRSAEHTSAEFERVREAIETVNRVLTLRLEKMDRQLMTVKRRCGTSGGGSDDRSSRETAASVQQQQQQMTELKAKVEILAQAAANQRASGSSVMRSASKDRKPENDGKPKMSDRVTYLESQCDGIEVALRGCLEEVASVVHQSSSQEDKGDAQMQQMQLQAENAESDSQQLSLVVSQVEQLASEVVLLKEREEQKAKGMLQMVDSLEKKVQSLDELPAVLTARVNDTLQAEIGKMQGGSMREVQGLAAEVEQFKNSQVDEQEKAKRMEASIVEIGDRVTCLETLVHTEEEAARVGGAVLAANDVHCYDNPARSRSLHPDHLTDHTASLLASGSTPVAPAETLSPPSPLPVAKTIRHPPASGGRGGRGAQQEQSWYQDPELSRSGQRVNVYHEPAEQLEQHRGMLHESAGGHRVHSSSRRSSSRRPREVPREEDAENADPAEQRTPPRQKGGRGRRDPSYREWEIQEDAADSPSPERWSRPPRMGKSPEMHSPEYRRQQDTRDNSKETLRDQLSAMMSGVNDLSDKYKGVDPVQRAAQATLLASQQTGPSQKRSSSVEGSSTVHSNPLASTVFDSIDANNDGYIDRGEFRKAYNHANGLVKMGTGSAQTQVVLPSPASNALDSNSVSRQMLGTPPLPARPSRASNEYLELRKKLLNSGTN